MGIFYKHLIVIFLWFYLLQSQYVDAEVVRTYYPDGHVKAEFNKEKGKLEGRTLWFYPDGAMGALMTYKSNKLHGKSEIYYQNGRVKKVVQMRDNRPVGVAENFSLNGKRTVTDFYFDGSVASRWTYDENEDNIFCEEMLTLSKIDNMKWNLDLSDELK